MNSYMDLLCHIGMTMSVIQMAIGVIILIAVGIKLLWAMFF